MVPGWAAFSSCQLSVARFSGLLVSSLPSVYYDRHYHHHLEEDYMEDNDDHHDLKDDHMDNNDDEHHCNHDLKDNHMDDNDNMPTVQEFFGAFVCTCSFYQPDDDNYLETIIDW